MLTSLQRQYLERAARGEKAEAIGEAFFVTGHAVASALARAYKALGVNSLPAAIAKAIALNEISNPWLEDERVAA